MITRIFLWLFSACKHEWETEEIRNLTEGGTIVGQRYYLRCTKCGNVKRTDLC
jgi:hypothetical protein